MSKILIKRIMWIGHQARKSGENLNLKVDLDKILDFDFLVLNKSISKQSVPGFTRYANCLTGMKCFDHENDLIQDQYSKQDETDYQLINSSRTIGRSHFTKQPV